MSHPVKRLSGLLLVMGVLLVGRVAGAGCGNGVVEAGEQCDDGNAVSSDGCSSACQTEPYYDCDNSSPSRCKINAVIVLSSLGISRATASNSATFLFQLNYDITLLGSINFNSIFTTSIPNSNIQIDYIATSSILKATIDFSTSIENTYHSFKLQLASTNLFWYDSETYSFQLHGTNCELTFQHSFWLQDVFCYVFLVIIVVVLLIGFGSILREKWIGLQLMQTYQSVYYTLLLLREFPYELTPLSQTLRFSNGYDNIFGKDITKSYPLPNQLNILSIRKQFIDNLNVSLCLIAAICAILIGLALYRSWLQYRLQCEVSSQVKKKMEKVTKYFGFVFGQVFVLLVLALMFKIISSFTVQLSQEKESESVFTDEANSTLAMVTFLILFGIIIFVFNWYIMIPETHTENQVFYSLQFRNMKFCYPIIYLVYQTVFIALVSIYYHRDYAPYALLALQVLYLGLIFYLWPYNTPRKINRILHNLNIVLNQSLLICVTILTFRWKAVLASQSSNSSEFLAYLFIIFALLLASTVLTILRLCFFNKDVQCFRPKEEEDVEEVRALNSKTLMEEVELVKKNSKEQSSLLRDESPRKTSQTENVSQFLNDKYSNWKRENSEEIKRAIKKSRPQKIRGTNQKLAELIKTPLDEFKEMKRLHATGLD